MNIKKRLQQVQEVQQKVDILQYVLCQILILYVIVIL